MIIVGGEATRREGVFLVKPEACVHPHSALPLPVPIRDVNRCVRALRPIAIGLGINKFHATPPDQRIASLFGSPEILGGSLQFWRKCLSRLSLKKFKFLRKIFRSKILGLADAIFDSKPKQEFIPVRVANLRETGVEVKSGLTEVVKGPPPLPPLAEMPFFRETRVPAEEPWWVDGRLPPSKRAFVEHFYCHDSDTLNLKPVDNREAVEHPMIGLALPGVGRVTVCLSAYELQIFSEILANGNEDFNLITPLFSVELDGDLGRLLYPKRLHICSEPHGACDRSSIKSFIKDNPWSQWEGMLKTESASSEAYFKVKSSQFAPVPESIPTASAGISS